MLHLCLFTNQLRVTKLYCVEMSANGSAACYNFTKMELESAYYTKISIAALGILLSGVVLLLFCISTVFRNFVYRLVFYLMLLNLAEAAILLMEVLPADMQDGEVFIRPNWGGVCSLFGFLDQIISWMGFTAIVWIMIYMLWLTYHLYKIQDGMLPERINIRKVSKKVEIVAISSLFITPFVLNWIPFIWGMYGLSGPWCWIKGTRSACDDITLGVTLMVLLFHGPIVLIVLFSFISFTVIVIIVCRATKLKGGNRKKANHVIREMILIVSYPLIYNILCVLLLANRIKEAINADQQEPPFFPLWMAEAIADPARTVLLPLAFLVHPKSWKNMFGKQENDFTESEYIVPPEDDDIEEGITIRSSNKLEAFTYGALLEPKEM